MTSGAPSTMLDGGGPSGGRPMTTGGEIRGFSLR